MVLILVSVILKIVMIVGSGVSSSYYGCSLLSRKNSVVRMDDAQECIDLK